MAKKDRSLAKGLDRSNKIDRAKIDADKRTIEVAFSSEEPVERWGENEVLSHDKGDYDFSRLNDSHPLLLGHAEYDPKSQIGVVESARVDNDKIGRAVVRFGSSTLAAEIFKDVQDGIRKLISVGYDRTGIVSSKKASDNMVTTRYRWMPTHIAIVPVPADTTVGVGRNKVKRQCADCDGSGRCRCRANEEDEADENCEDCGGNGRCADCNGTGYFTSAKSKVDFLKELKADDLTQEQKNQMRLLLDSKPADGGTAVVEADVRKNEREKIVNRKKEIEAIATELIKDYGDRDNGQMKDKIRGMANEAILSDETIEKFQLRCVQDVLKGKEAKPVTLEDVTDERDRKRYSILRGIQSCMARKSNEPDGLEGEVHKAILNRAQEFGGIGYDAKGFQVPHNVPSPRTNGMSMLTRDEFRRREGRDMQATIFGQGGAFVPTQLVVPVIELLRNMIVLDKLGMRVMAGLQGNIIIPRQDAAATAYSVTETGPLISSNQVLGQIALTPHRVGATQNYSKQFLMQSTPDAEAFLRDDLFKVIAIDHDRLGLNGQGAASEPLGIMNTPGINAITFATAAKPTYLETIQMETDIRSLNVMDDLAYVSTSTVKGNLKGIAEALTGATTVGGSANAIWKGKGRDMGEVNGWPAHDTQQVPNNQTICGAFTHLILAIWGGLDVVVEPYTLAKNAEWVITINTWIDYTVRHAQAFTVSTN